MTQEVATQRNVKPTAGEHSTDSRSITDGGRSDGSLGSGSGSERWRATVIGETPGISGDGVRMRSTIGDCIDFRMRLTGVFIGFIELKSDVNFSQM